MADYNFKLILAGRFIETLEYGRLPIYNNKLGIKTGTRSLTPNSNKNKFSNFRSIAHIRHLIYTNNKLIRFVTLTFKENITDISLANKEFNLFIKRLKYIFPDIQYIAVPEYQKRGAVHYHLLINRYLDFKLLSQVWGLGFVFIKKIKTKDFYNYLVKYLRKNFEDVRLFNKKRYFFSSGLLRPLIFYGQTALNIYLKYSSKWLHSFEFRKKLNYLGELIFNSYLAKNTSLYNQAKLLT